jgi:hypothetical protein
MVVDLPAPLGPRKPSTSPVATRRSRPSKARVVPNVFTSPLMSMASLTVHTVRNARQPSGRRPISLRPRPRPLRSRTGSVRIDSANLGRSTDILRRQVEGGLAGGRGQATTAEFVADRWIGRLAGRPALDLVSRHLATCLRQRPGGRGTVVIR